MAYSYYLDLRFVPPGIVHHIHAYAVLRELGPHEILKVRSPYDPALFLLPLQHLVDHTLVTAVTPDGGGWTIEVRTRRTDESLIDTLHRDHNQLDDRFADAIRCSVPATMNKGSGHSQTSTARCGPTSPPKTTTGTACTQDRGGGDRTHAPRAPRPLDAARHHCLTRRRNDTPGARGVDKPPCCRIQQA